MSLLTLYLAFVLLPNISSLSGVVVEITMTITLVSLVASVVWFTNAYSDDEKKITETLFKFTKQISIVCICASLIGLFAPDQKQVYLLAGGYAVTNSDQIKQLPENIAKAANNYLEKMAEDFSKEEKKN